MSSPFAYTDSSPPGPSASSRRRLFKAIDDLTVKWAIGELPEECRWLLNTQAMFLQKAREPECKLSDDEEWLAVLSQNDFLEENLDGATGDVPESMVVEQAPCGRHYKSLLALTRHPA